WVLARISQVLSGRDRRKRPSQRPPVAARWPSSRAGTTRVSSRTRMSPGASNSGKSAKTRCCHVADRRSTTISRERSRGSTGCWAISSAGRLKSKAEVCKCFPGEGGGGRIEEEVEPPRRQGRGEKRRKSSRFCF